MPPPSNTTGATAIDVGTLPASINQNVHDSGTTYNVWYKYTAVTGDTMIGIFGWGGTPDTGYQPNLYVYGPNSYTAPLFSTSRNSAGQLYVQVGSTYYFKFEPNTTTITPANLTLSVVKFIESAYSIGDILIPDDNPGFPGAIISSTTGSPLTYLPNFPTNEDGFVLDNGIMIVDDNNDSIVKIFNPDFSLIIALTSLPYISSLTGNFTDKFYSVHNSNPPTVWRITSTGVFTQVATLPMITSGGGVRGIAVSPDESILYYKVYPGSDFNKLKRHNLLTDTALSNLTDGPVAHNQSARETICLKDGTIITTYSSSTGLPNDYRIIRYNPDGSIANTYINVGGFTFPGTMRLAHAIDNPNSFWVWFTPAPTISGDAGISAFLNIKTSDGSILRNIDGQQYEVGEYLGPQTATPERFGHSESCPFLILRQGNEPLPSNYSGIYQIKRGKTNDTVYTGSDPATQVRKIPDPFIKTSIVGG